MTLWLDMTSTVSLNHTITGPSIISHTHVKLMREWFTLKTTPKDNWNNTCWHVTLPAINHVSQARLWTLAALNYVKICYILASNEIYWFDLNQCHCGEWPNGSMQPVIEHLQALGSQCRFHCLIDEGSESIQHRPWQWLNDESNDVSQHLLPTWRIWRHIAQTCCQSLARGGQFWDDLAQVIQACVSREGLRPRQCLNLSDALHQIRHVEGRTATGKLICGGIAGSTHRLQTLHLAVRHLVGSSPHPKIRWSTPWHEVSVSLGLPPLLTLKASSFELLHQFVKHRWQSLTQQLLSKIANLFASLIDHFGGVSTELFWPCLRGLAKTLDALHNSSSWKTLSVRHDVLELGGFPWLKSGCVTVTLPQHLVQHGQEVDLGSKVLVHAPIQVLFNSIRCMAHVVLLGRCEYIK